MNAKQFTLLIICNIFLTNCHNLKYLKAHDGFKGKPKIVETQQISILEANDTIREKLSSMDIFYYDKKGRIINWEDFYGPVKKKYNQRWHYGYDKNGNVVEFYEVGLDGSISHIVYYEHNKYGQLIEEKVDSVVRKRITYDRKKRTSELIAVDESDECREKVITKYNEDWKELKILIYDCENNLKSKIEKQYDSKGNQVASKWYNSNNVMHTIYRSDFNDKGQPKKTYSMNINGQDTLITKEKNIDYKYDTYGNIIEEKVFSEGKIMSLSRNIITY